MAQNRSRDGERTGSCVASMLRDLHFRLRALFRRRTVDAELNDELREHLAHLIGKYESAGLTPEEAARRANMEFGGLEQIKDECRDARGVGFVETLARDLRYAIRVLKLDASVSLIALISLALAIGASTTVFS